MPGLITATILITLSVIALVALFKNGLHRRIHSLSSVTARLSSRLIALTAITLILAIFGVLSFLAAAMGGSATPILIIIFFFIISAGIYHAVTSALEIPSGQFGKMTFFIAFWIIMLSIFYILDGSFAWGILSPPPAPTQAVDYSHESEPFNGLF